MPDLGVPSSTSPQPASHTSTHEWQSFEMRMRRRRAERCVVRAEVALDAGFEEDARAALAEAHRLDSASPDLDTLRARLLERRAAEAVSRRDARRRRIRVSAIAAVLTLAAAAGVLTVSGDRQASPDAEVVRVGEAPMGTSGADAPPAPEGTLTPTPNGDGVAAVLGSKDKAAASGASDALEERERPTAPAAGKATADEKDAKKDGGEKPSAAPQPVAANVTPPPPSREPVREPRAVPASFDRPAPPEPLPAVGDLRSSPPPAIPLVSASSSVSSLPGTPTTPAPAIPAPPSDEPLVRALLTRYETAYSSLNASAAQAIWPAVDAASLARAFNSLESQQVSLGRCRLAISGSTASANCAGSATWTPKIGGGTRTEAREWRFELAKAGATWQIVNASAR